MTVLMEGQAPRTGANRINSQFVLVGAVLMVIIASRFAMLNYNSASVDEAIALSVGHRVLSGDFRDNALQWMAGSYGHPVAAALAASLSPSGLENARGLSALFGSISAFGVYLIALRLFGRQAALLAMVIYGFTGVSMFVATQATAASMGSALLATGAGLLTFGLTTPIPKRQLPLLLAAAFCFGLAIWTQYIVVLWLLPIGVFALILALRGDWPRLGILFGGFIAPVTVMLVGYPLLAGVEPGHFLGQMIPWSNLTSPNMATTERLSSAIRLPLALALCVFLPGLPDQTRSKRIPLALLWVAALIAPLVCLFAIPRIPLEQLMAYAIVFLAPLAGLGMLLLLRMITQGANRQMVALALTALYLLVALQIWNDYAWGMQRTWPNVNRVVANLRTLPVTPETPILAEGGNIYDYYLGWGSGAQLTATWSSDFTYAGQRGADALETAVNEGHFTYLVLDRYYTPDVSARLVRAATTHGYRVIFQDTVQIPGGSQQPVTTEVYARLPR